MKIAAQFLALAIAVIGMSSCCSIGLCNDNGKKVEKHVVEYNQVEVPGAKGVSYENQAVTKTVLVDECPDPCIYNYCPERKCCGTLSDEYFARATAQPSTGSPFIGLIPTMKPLAE